MAAVPERQVEDLVAIREQHERAGYESELVTGAAACREYLTWSWPDWEAPVEAVLHERRGGWADAMQTVRHLAARARAAGAEIREDVEVTGFEPGLLHTSQGRVECETVVACPGPWVEPMWELLGLTPTVEVDGHPRPLVDVHQGAGGRVRARGRRPERVGGRRGAGRAPGPGRTAALRPRRERARGRPLGHLLPHGPDRHRHHRRRPARLSRQPAARPVRARQPRARGRARVHGLLHSGLADRPAPLPRPRRATGA